MSTNKMEIDGNDPDFDPGLVAYLEQAAQTLGVPDWQGILQGHVGMRDHEDDESVDGDGESHSDIDEEKEDADQGGFMTIDWAKTTEGPSIPSVLEPGHTLKLHEVDQRKPTFYTFATKKNSSTTRTGMPQTDLINRSYPDDEAIEGSAFVRFDTQGIDTAPPSNKAQKRRFDRGAVTGDQGPHTQAHVMIGKMFESAVPERIAGEPMKRWRAVEEFWVTKIDSPQEVFEAVQSELSGNNNAVLAEDYIANLNNAMGRYVEMFNQGEVLLDSVWAPALAAQKGEYGDPTTQQYQEWAARDEEMYQTARKIMDAMWELFPYGSYAWQRGGKKASAAELAGKGERGKPFVDALETLQASKGDPTTHFAALQAMAKVIAPMIDGFSQFRSKEQFRRYLMKRMEVIDLEEADVLMQLVIKEKS